jgi:hypothetical protein
MVKIDKLHLNLNREEIVDWRQAGIVVGPENEKIKNMPCLSRISS